MKKQWIKKNDQVALSADQEKHNTALYDRIKELKTARDEININIIGKKQDLQNARRDIYKFRSNRTRVEEDPKTKYLITNQHYTSMDNVKNFKIQEDLLESNNVTFSGTDYGLVTMTESVAMSLDRFKFHIDLYNRFFYS